MHLRFFTRLSFFVLLASLTAVGQKPELVVQTGHSSSVASVAISPDGKTLASGSADNTIKLWDLASGKQLYSLTGHSNTVKSVVFSRDGKTLASAGGSNDQTIKLWDVASGVEVRSFEPHDYIESVALSPDGKTLASANERSVKLWDVASGRELWSAKVAQANFTVAFSPDGKVLASGTYSDVILFDVADGKELHRLRHAAGDFLRGVKRVLCVVFSPDGRTLASAAEDKTIKVWDITHRSELRTLEGHVAAVSAVVFTPDGKTLASGSSDKTIKLWDVARGSEVRTLTEQSEVNALAFTPDGATLASGVTDPVIRLWKVADGTELPPLVGHSSLMQSVAFSPDGMTLASGSDHSVIMWDIKNGNEVRLLNGHSGKIYSLAFSPDGRTLASGSEDHTVKLWDVSSGKELRTLNGHSDDVKAVVFSLDGKTLASGSLDTTIRLWDVASGKELKERSPGDWQDDEFEFSTLMFSSSGRVLAGGIGDGTINLWDVAKETELQSIAAKTSGIQCVAFSPNLDMVATGSWNSTMIEVWDVKSRKHLRTLKGHSEGVRTLAFSHDGKMLASGGDAFIKLWDVNGGRELVSLAILDNQNWLVSTPSGLFDGSPAAWSRILWRFNNNVFDHAPVEAFFSEFYYPGLLADVFAGKHPKAPGDISQKDRRQPQLKLELADAQPGTKLTARNLKLKIDVAELAADKEHKLGSGAQDVRLFRNGAMIKAWRGDVLKGQSSVTLDETVSIVAGRNNFTAYAFNRDNIKSTDATLIVNGAESLKRSGTAYILAVGVNSYSNSEYNLKYAVADAEDFSAEVKRQQELLKRYAQVEVISLQDAEATKTHIIEKLAQLATRVQPEDAVIIYFAGHGTAHGNQFYLIPHDLGYAGPREKLTEPGLQVILAHSISDRELEKLFEGIDASQLLLVIDACNSGQALEAEEKRRGPMNSKGLAQLAYEKGMYVLTAAQSYQAAQEAAKFGHGFLTYALVEDGLKRGAADREPKDSSINLREWLTYATEQVPKMQEENMLDALRGRGRYLNFVGDGSGPKDNKNNVQRPRIFYRRELDSNPLVIAVVGASSSP